MDANAVASNVARAILSAMDWTSSPDARNAAVSYLDSVKAGDVRLLASSSFLLVKRDWSSEIRLHAFKMLQHLVRFRWDELDPADRRDFAKFAFDLMSEMANNCEEWALKSQTAALIAEIVRREGLSLLQELLPSLVSLSNLGPVHAELVSMMLRWLPEDVTVHNEDLEGDRRRLLLRGLTESLPEILPLLYNLLERHFGAAISEAGRQQMDIAKQHAATVTSVLNAINAFAEWAPLPDLSKYGAISACGFLLSSPDFRLHACDFFKLVSSRKRPVDADAEFDSSVSNIFQVVMNVSTTLLNRSGAGVMDDSEIEFAECICESMASLGSSNLQSVAGDNALLSLYLQQMLGYYKHYKLSLHFLSLMFWLALLKELFSKPKSSGEGLLNSLSFSSGQGDSYKAKIFPFLNDDTCSAILDISFQRMLNKEKFNIGKEHPAGGLELWSDEFEGKGGFSQYRSRLLELIRIVATEKPLVAAAKVSEKIMIVINHFHNPFTVEELALLESMQVALDLITGPVFDGSNDYAESGSGIHITLCKIYEGLLQQLLSLRWTEPELVEVLGHYLHAFGPFLKHYTDAVGSVINKLFELLTSLPIFVEDPSTSKARYARLQICTSFIRIAKAADISLFPHMKGIAETMSLLQKEGHLLRAEYNLIGEAFLVIASAAGGQQQQEVLAWLLEPLSQQWTQLEWQNAYLSDPKGLVALCAQTQFMWSLFHNVTFFEKALKNSGGRKGNESSSNSTSESNPSKHPLSSHLSWMLPPVLKLLRAVHSLWSPSITLTLPGEIRAAMAMSDAERISLLGEGKPKMIKGAVTFADGSQFDMNKESHSQQNEVDIRNWLKGIRDSGYNVLGLSTTLGDSFFQCLDVQSVTLALMENIQFMDFRHMRQLLHSVMIPLVKNCPSALWDVWLDKLLSPLLLHAHLALSCSWSSLLGEGRAKVPDNPGILAESDLKVEVMEEKLLRALTREVCSLLGVLGASNLNSGLPSLDQSGLVIKRGDFTSLKDLDSLASSSITASILKNKNLAVPALKITLDVFRWADHEAVIKIATFGGAVVLVSISANNLELQHFVCKDLFSMLIQGLALESNALVSSNLIGLCREIFIHFYERDPSPRQILLSLPCIKHQDLIAFEDSLRKTSSPKEQKMLLKSFLSLATGDQLKALAVQKSVNVITNVSARPRSLLSVPESGKEEGAIGLAAIM